MFLAKVYITYKKGVLDPQGSTVKKALGTMGFDTVEDVRVGKYMEIMLEEKEKDLAEQKVKEMCNKVLTNPVIEEYSYDILEVKK